MSGFQGCDTEQMRRLAATIRAGVRRLDAQQAVLESARSVSWTGPDAERFRTELAAAGAGVRSRGDALRVAAGQLEEDAAQQDEVSAAVSADLSKLLGPGRDMAKALFRAAKSKASQPRPNLPLWPANPLLPILEDTARDLDRPRRPLDPDFDLDADDRQTGSDLRHGLVDAIPYAGQVQGLMDARDRMTAATDSLEGAAQRAGLGRWTAPLFSGHRVSGMVGEALIGEHSAIGELATRLDDTLGNGARTLQDAGTALEEGDLGGVARAGEEGAFRQLGVTLDTATYTPVPLVGEALSSAYEHGADLQDLPVFDGTPINGDHARAMQERIDAGVETWERGRDNATDVKPLLDARREHAPMPWDE